ncbi:MAG: hypothetical protein EOP49_14360 [Sphingobacteriales bacterium]|nr:MAG: hypothetical protein EOP49_14360 [Sphingobacteriales bacterium]
MKNTISVLMLAAATLVACNKKSEEATEDAAGSAVVQDSVVDAPGPAEPIAECYEFVQKKDTISLSVIENGASVTGNLMFKNFEKDSSHGTVIGTTSGDTLKLTYTFQSEGTQSKRDMYFLKDGVKLRMGTGDMQDKDGAMTFTSPKTVLYGNAIVLSKTECK